MYKNGKAFTDVISGTCGPGGSYTAGIGWDYCTGLGAPNGKNGF